MILECALWIQVDDEAYFTESSRHSACGIDGGLVNSAQIARIDETCCGTLPLREDPKEEVNL